MKFLEAIANVFRIPDLRKRVLFALAMLPVLVHSPPQIVTVSFEGEYHLVEVPLASRPRTAAELIGVLLAQLAAPFADSLLGHHNSTFT